ncbi:MAG: tetratricopeptide repeat protein [Luteolibacter sp.]
MAQNTPAPAQIAVTDVISPAQINRLFNEVDADFESKNFSAIPAKINQLIKALANTPDAPLETLYFNIGLAHLLDNKAAEAEAGFRECLKRFPNGEYASRCFLGAGRALTMQGSEEKKNQAIEPLKRAAADPKFRSEAGLILGQVYTDLGKHDDALQVFRSLMGSDVRTPTQTAAAVQSVSLLANSGSLKDLIAYLDRLSSQAGVRDAIAWYVNQNIVCADELVSNQLFEPALAIYRSIPPRSQIISTQAAALNEMRKELKILETRAEADKAKPANQRSKAAELVGALKPAIKVAEEAYKAIDEKADFDAAVLMRRGRCLFYLERHEEALVCFRKLRTKYGSSVDAKSAAFAEIVILNKRQDIASIKELCEAYMQKYPDAENIEQVATLAGEVLVQSGNWKEVASFYRGLETKFPQSENLDRFVFFQALAVFQEGRFAEAAPMISKFLKDHPQSLLVENAMYYFAMSNFLSNKYKETLAACNDYLNKFPDGRYAGDMRYRLAFVDFNDKDEDQSEKVIRDLSKFLSEHPNDSSNGSMYCLLADTYARIGKDTEALEAYKNAIWTESPDDVIQYGLDSATSILQGKKDWAGVGELHGDFLKRRPDSALALLSATWVAKMKAREGKGAEAGQMLGDALKDRISKPSNEQVEFLIDELVKTMVPRKKPADIDIDALDKQLTDLLAQVTAGQENPTTAARIYYARARLAQLLRRNDRSDLYMKGIATINAKDPMVLSPALLAVSGDILLKSGDDNGAEAMFKHLVERYSDSSFSDAGPVGMGLVALARKKPDEALKIFDDALQNNPGMSRFKEATLGKLQALVELEKYEEATQLALNTVGDKMFRGQSAADAYMLLAKAYRKQATKLAGPEGVELLKKAHGTYQRVYVAYQGFPEVCAEAYWQAYETAQKLGEETLAAETLKALREHPKLTNTEAAKRAAATN